MGGRGVGWRNVALVLAFVACERVDPDKEVRRTTSTSESHERHFFAVVNGDTEQFIYLDQFRTYVDTLAAYGVTGLRLWIPWQVVCTTCGPTLLTLSVEHRPGRYDFSQVFQRVDYAVQHGLAVILTIDWTGHLSTDPLGPGAHSVLPTDFGLDDVMLCRDRHGTDVPFEYRGTRVPRFEKPAVRDRLLRFVDATVTQFRARYGDSVLYYGFVFSPFGEAEFPPLADSLPDTSPESLSAFREWLRTRYPTASSASEAWLRPEAFRSFDQIEILDGQPPPPTGTAPQSYLDFAAFREASLGRFLAAIRDHVHAAGGRALVQFGSVWDSSAASRGTIGFGHLASGYDLLVVDDDPNYDHAFSMDYVRSNIAVPFGSELDSICALACRSRDSARCCDAKTFPLNVDLEYGATRMKAQVDDTFARGGTFIGMANWEPFYSIAFRSLAPTLAYTVGQEPRNPLPVSAITIDLSQRDLYVHHNDPAYVDRLLSAHAALREQAISINLNLRYDL